MKEFLHSADCGVSITMNNSKLAESVLVNNIMFLKGQWYCTLGKGNEKNRELVHKRPKINITAGAVCLAIQ